MPDRTPHDHVGNFVRVLDAAGRTVAAYRPGDPGAAIINTDLSASASASSSTTGAPVAWGRIVGVGVAVVGGLALLAYLTRGRRVGGDA